MMKPAPPEIGNFGSEIYADSTYLCRDLLPDGTYRTKGRRIRCTHQRVAFLTYKEAIANQRKPPNPKRFRVDLLEQNENGTRWKSVEYWIYSPRHPWRCLR